MLLRLLLWVLAVVLIVIWVVACAVVWVVESLVARRRGTSVPRLTVPRRTSDAKFGRTAGVAAALVAVLVVIGGSGSGSGGTSPRSAEAATPAAATQPVTSVVKEASTVDATRAAKRKARAAKARAERRRERLAAERRAKAKKAAAARAAAAKRAAAQPRCDTSYKGACLDPDASDYDCAGGSGDGPKYTGVVTVVGDDHFDLDRDGDGIGCETS